MRSLLFNIAYWILSIFYVLTAALAALTPGRGAVRKVISRYTRRMILAMRLFAGIRLEVRGKARLGTILKKLGAIVVNSCGGPEPRQALTQSAAQAKAERRKILIYPEGHLARVSELIAEATGKPVRPSVLVPSPGEGTPAPLPA